MKRTSLFYWYHISASGNFIQKGPVLFMTYTSISHVNPLKLCNPHTSWFFSIFFILTSENITKLPSLKKKKSVFIWPASLLADQTTLNLPFPFINKFLKRSSIFSSPRIILHSMVVCFGPHRSFDSALRPAPNRHLPLKLSPHFPGIVAFSPWFLSSLVLCASTFMVFFEHFARGKPFYSMVFLLSCPWMLLFLRA